MNSNTDDLQLVDFLSRHPYEAWSGSEQHILPVSFDDKHQAFDLSNSNIGATSYQDVCAKELIVSNPGQSVPTK